jgi:hypothetical protein
MIVIMKNHATDATMPLAHHPMNRNQMARTRSPGPVLCSTT